jgi:hypothetical protein
MLSRIQSVVHTYLFCDCGVDGLQVRNECKRQWFKSEKGLSRDVDGGRRIPSISPLRAEQRHFSTLRQPLYYFSTLNSSILLFRPLTDHDYTEVRGVSHGQGTGCVETVRQ